MRFALVLLLGATTGLAAPVPKDFRKADEKTLIAGTWIAGVLNGNPAGRGGTHTFIFSADGTVRTLFGENGTSDWTWTVDPTVSPKQMKWASVGGHGATFDCIYEITPDTFKLGFLTKGQPVPAKVEPGPGVTLYEMNREKAGK